MTYFACLASEKARHYWEKAMPWVFVFCGPQTCFR